VMATDLFEGYLAEARGKDYPAGNVTFRRADAYFLEGIGRDFTAAFSADWWSHMPRSRVPTFLRALHGRLRPGARVVMLDMLRGPELQAWFSHVDEGGDEVQRRDLPNGKDYLVVKNYPTEPELRSALGGAATGVRYVEDAALARWALTYTLVASP